MVKEEKWNINDLKNINYNKVNDFLFFQFRSLVLDLFVQVVSVQGVYVWGVYILGGKYPGGYMSGGYMSGGKCLGGTCPGGYVLEPFKC